MRTPDQISCVELYSGRLAQGFKNAWWQVERRCAHRGAAACVESGALQSWAGTLIDTMEGTLWINLLESYDPLIFILIPFLFWQIFLFLFHLLQFGGMGKLRMCKGGKAGPVVTDNGNSHSRIRITHPGVYECLLLLRLSRGCPFLIYLGTLSHAHPPHFWELRMLALSALNVPSTLAGVEMTTDNKTPLNFNRGQ